MQCWLNMMLIIQEAALCHRYRGRQQASYNRFLTILHHPTQIMNLSRHATTMQENVFVPAGVCNPEPGEGHRHK